MAKELNYPETVFIFAGSSEIAAELRVFSPAGERSVGSRSVAAAARPLLVTEVLAAG
jgi:predicted PhzF superfamily epimerase YddE/YHI9